MDTNEIVATAEAVNGGAKMISSITALIGKIYEPRYIRKKADAEAYRINKISETLRENNDVLAKFDDGSLSASLPEDLSELIERTKYRTVCQELQKQQNLEQVLDNAYEQLENKEVSDTPVDNDWLTRFINCAEEVSNEDMQKLWGKILAGEIEKPGNCSKRTLSIIMNISKNEAEMFELISKFIIRSSEKFFILNDDTINKLYGINYEQIMKLSDCGLMVDNALLKQSSTLVANSNISMFSKETFLEYKNKTENSVVISYPVFTLTNAGKELYKLLDNPSDESYILNVADNIYKNNAHQLNIFAFHITRRYDDFINYNPIPFKQWNR